MRGQRGRAGAPCYSESMYDTIKKLMVEHLRAPLEHPSFRTEITDDYVRFVGHGDTEFENTVVWANAGSHAEWEKLVRRQKKFYADLGKSFEWKYSALLQPPSLKEILLREGFTVGDPETQFAWTPATGIPELPAGITVEELTLPEDLPTIVKIQTDVWGMEFGNLLDELTLEKQKEPTKLRFFGARQGDLFISVGWLRAYGRVGTLHGGSTLKSHRRRGAFRALVHRRLLTAEEAGLAMVYVDCTSYSSPIFERLGWTNLGETIPFVQKS